MKKVLFILLTIISLKASAQGDGARMLLWGPKGVTSIIPKWMYMDQNILPANILVKTADVKINAFPVTVIHNFSLSGRFAQVMLNAVPGSVKGSLVADIMGNRTPQLSSSGFADGFAGFKLGLINQPALDVKQYAEHAHKIFSMMGYFRLWYPGSYSSSSALNLGSNRFTFELGFPVNIHLGNNPKRPFWLEVYPAMHLYTANNNPSFITMGDKTTQTPLFSIENHLSRNFTDKLWAGIDVRYQYGGALKVDEVNQDNIINLLGAGVTMGYKFLPILDVNVNYSGRVADGSDIKSQMFKVSAVLSYVNMNKVK